MTEKELKYLLCEEQVTVKLSGADGNVIVVDPQLSFSVSSVYETNISGYDLYTDGENSEFYETFEGLVEKLKAMQVFKNGEAELLSINDAFKSLEEYEEKKAFDCLDMAGLLDKYMPIADSFSLTCPYGDYNISGELADKALTEIKKLMYNSAKEQFECSHGDERAKLPPFDVLYDNVAREYGEYRKKHKRRIEKNDGFAYFYDVFGEGKGNYKEPEELWHTYFAVDFVGDCSRDLERLKNTGRKQALETELDNEHYRILKANLLKTDVAFGNHCTISGMLSKTFYFKLNETTARWLLQFQTDFDLKYLEDLAFYKDGELIFSSCTHERYHNDYTNHREVKNG